MLSLPVVRARFEPLRRSLFAPDWGLPAVGGSGRAQGKLTSVERGGPCPAMWAR